MRKVSAGVKSLPTSTFFNGALGEFGLAELQVHCSAFGNGTRSSSLPTQPEAVLGHALGLQETRLL